MTTVNPLLNTDFYKQSHYKMYPDNMRRLYSNFTPRKSRFPEITSVVVFGLQYYLEEYLKQSWTNGFFGRPKDNVVFRYKRLIDHTLGKDAVDTTHLEKLHDLGYLPLHIKALDEGSLCPIGVPCLTVTNTHPDHGWLVNFIETSLSNTIWQPITSATLARQFRLLFERYALETTGSTEGVAFQGHDFSMRGMSSLETACTSGAAHLLSFSGTDSIPAIEFLETYYGACLENELIGASVPASEHSVMSMGTKDGEQQTFERLLDLFPTGILSVVSDTWNLWQVCTEFLPNLKDKILARDGKLVIRPDSGDPVDILCGTLGQLDPWFDESTGYPPSKKGVIELLWDVFGGTTNEQGYKVLDPHIGAIYGDSINLERAEEICRRLRAKGFASTNWVAGVGSYTYQLVTRDTFGFAMKATYGEVEVPFDAKWSDGGQDARIEPRIIFKDPITDDGTKRSAKGLLRVERNESGVLQLFDQQTWEQEAMGELKTVFLNGNLTNPQTLAQIRERLNH